MRFARGGFGRWVVLSVGTVLLAGALEGPTPGVFVEEFDALDLVAAL